MRLLQLVFSLDASFAKHKIIEEKWKFLEKPLNFIRKTDEKNRRTNINNLAP